MYIIFSDTVLLTYDRSICTSDTLPSVHIAGHTHLSAVSNSDRLELCRGGALKALCVWTVRSHHGVECCSPGPEPFLLGLVVPVNETHEFGHTVT